VDHLLFQLTGAPYYQTTVSSNACLVAAGNAVVHVYIVRCVLLAVDRCLNQVPASSPYLQFPGLHISMSERYDTAKREFLHAQS